MIRAHKNCIIFMIFNDLYCFQISVGSQLQYVVSCLEEVILSIVISTILCIGSWFITSSILDTTREQKVFHNKKLQLWTKRSMNCKISFNSWLQALFFSPNSYNHLELIPSKPAELSVQTHDKDYEALRRFLTPT